MPPHQARSQATRDAIVLSAQQNFAANGYDAASISQICRHAKISKGAFYHHFESKQVLFLEVLGGWLAQLDAELERMVSQGLGVPETIGLMANLLGQIMEQGQDQLPLILTFWQQARKEDVVWEEAFAPFDRYRTYFADMIQRGIDEGSLEGINPELGAQTLISLVVGLLLQSLLDTESEGWSDIATSCIRQVVGSWQRNNGTA